MRKGWSRWWWGAGATLIAARALCAVFAPAWAGTLLTFLLVLWSIPSAAWVAYRVWRRLTYRIGVRLLLSYLLIGVTPFALMLAVAALAGYILIGQYCSARYAALQQSLEEELAEAAGGAVKAAAEAGPEAAQALLAGRRAFQRVELPRVEWILEGPAGSWRSPGAGELASPGWAEEGALAGAFDAGGELTLVAVARRGDWVAAVLLPLDPATAEAVSTGRWYEVRFVRGDVTGEGDNIEIHTGRRSAAGAGGESPSEEAESPEPEEPEAGESAAPGEGLWQRRWIYFVRPGAELRSWEDGAPKSPREALVAILVTSPAEAAEDLFRSPYPLGPALLGGFLGASIFFFAFYLAIVAVAAVQIVSVARSTARLTRGTQRVEAGDLAHRIPVRRRDQLGDLALSFNRMASSVEGMLAEVAEKERLKREMELAREIQQSLLPDLEVRQGPLTVQALFQPAAEVGGDYFDLFPLEGGRLIVAIGDVAGHGLSTGLLMAMVKSAMATLIRDGHRGVPLFERLNEFMRQQPREHRMLTLAVAEIDAAAGTAEITSAGHPPAFVLGAGGDVAEVLLPSLPLGSRWRQPPPARRLALGRGSRLFFYSDGLTEAADPTGEAFGYDRLRRTLATHAGLPAGELLSALRREVEEHTAGGPQADDLTLLLVDHRRAPA